MPTSFDVSVPIVERTLARTNALVFARESISYNQIKNLCCAEVAHDCAFFFDFSPFKRTGKGVLIAYRQDKESPGYELPAGNIDISKTCESLDEWLWTISRHEIVRTNRAHVMLAAALLGKTVYYRASNYHKVPAIADFGLRAFPVYHEDEPNSAFLSSKPAVSYHSELNDREYSELIHKTKTDILKFIPSDKKFILIDDEQIRSYLQERPFTIPFLEKNGEYWGPPADDVTAIKELNRLSQNGAAFLVIAWPAFWWLEQYAAWYQCLSTHYPCLVDNNRLKIFDLRRSVTDSKENEKIGNNGR